jgi:hypothetical protein
MKLGAPSVQALHIREHAAMFRQLRKVFRRGLHTTAAGGTYPGWQEDHCRMEARKSLAIPNMII